MRSVEPDAELVASAPRSVPFLRFQLVLWTLQLVLWGSQAVTEGGRLQIVMAVLSAVGVAVHGSMLVGGSPAQLVLVDDRLELRRRFRPLSIDRSAIVAVRGDVPGRPTWSQGVIVETTSGDVPLPALDRKVPEVIARLQEWADVGEHGSTSAESGLPGVDRA